MQPEHFANAPPDTIAHHGAAQCFFYADAEAAAHGIVWAEENDELLTRAPAATAMNDFEIAAAQEA